MNDNIVNAVKAALRVSNSAKEEAKELLKTGIPENFSGDKELEAFVRKAKEAGTFDVTEFINLDTFKDGTQLERCQAVLITILFNK